MKRINLVSDANFVGEEVPIPEISEDEVLVEVHVSGICGSDMHSYHGTHPYVSFPIVMGHEFSGVVSQVGARANRDLLGKRVTVEPSLVCGECYNCKHGKYNICKKLKVLGCQTDGAFAQYVKAPANKIYVLPDSVSFEDGAMVEPLAVAVHAVRQAKLSGGEKVVVLGGGTIGLLTACSAKQLGASDVTIVDFLSEKLDVAKKMGIDHTINLSGSDLREELVKIYGKDGPDVWFECVGSEKTISDAVTIARDGTKLIVVGVFSQPIMTDMGLVELKELELTGVLMYRGGDFATAIDLIAQNKVSVSNLVTAKFSISKVAEAFKNIEDHPRTSFKTLLKINDSF
jgi:L-iditol 2-dehydrogenase